MALRKCCLKVPA